MVRGKACLKYNHCPDESDGRERRMSLTGAKGTKKVKATKKRGKGDGFTTPQRMAIKMVEKNPGLGNVEVSRALMERGYVESGKYLSAATSQKPSLRQKIQQLRDKAEQSTLRDFPAARKVVQLAVRKKEPWAAKLIYEYAMPKKREEPIIIPPTISLPNAQALQQVNLVKVEQIVARESGKTVEVMREGEKGDG